jgi:hypothetical protein
LQQINGLPTITVVALGSNTLAADDDLIKGGGAADVHRATSCKDSDYESLCLSVLSMVLVPFLNEWIGKIFNSMNRLQK